jgi:hypothetical protein
MESVIYTTLWRRMRDKKVRFVSYVHLMEVSANLPPPLSLISEDRVTGTFWIGG